MKHPTENEHKWKMTTLSELLVRIEEQKLACIIRRLINHWGINPKSIIPMHDGAMVSLRNLHPEKELIKMLKPTINQHVLEDIVLYTRKTMSVFLKLTVKKGHEATDIVCDVPWPNEACLNQTPPDRPDRSNTTMLALNNAKCNCLRYFDQMDPPSFNVDALYSTVTNAEIIFTHSLGVNTTAGIYVVLFC
jgi:hypothetical protein